MSPAATIGSHSQVRFLPLSYDCHNSHPSALKLILALFPHWGLDDSKIELVRFTDGITNTLLKAVNRRPGMSKADVDRDAILLRAYGNGTAVIIDREREAANHELLMRYGLAPDLLARFANGMLYRFVRGAVAQPKDLCDDQILLAIARRLAQWHATVPCLPDQSFSEASHEPPYNNDIDLDNTRKSMMMMKMAAGKPIPNLWMSLQKFILALPVATDAQRQRRALLQQELEDMVGNLSQRPGLGPNGLVFAHCDLLSGNVIIHREVGKEPSVSFIDYEYATPSPAAFDIANHFAEWTGFDCDYSAIPTTAQRYAFISEYIKSYADLSGKAMDLEEETRKLMHEVDVFRGVPGFYWGVWALIQAEISHIDFDYTSYAEVRLAEWFDYKAEQDGSRQASGREKPLRERMWSRSG